MKGQMKDIYPSKPKKAPKMIKKDMMMLLLPEENQSSVFSSPVRSEKDQVVVDTTPKPMVLTLERDKRIRRSKSKKPIESESVSEKTVGGVSNKRKRKSSTSMKEMAESNKSLKIPFLL